jgi:molecular chaperone HtpG
MAANSQTFEFQAETKQLLDLMIYSLYTNKEIFLRELISNASDALDRLRYEALTRPELARDSDKSEIRLEVDHELRTLTISDNGIGMSREEVITNIGTIAKSGTRELHNKIKGGASNESIAEFIGQFGVGFYSSFMVADQVSLVTRRAGEETAVRWESTGDGQYTLTSAEKAQPGTAVTLRLKPVDPENGIEDFTDKWILARIVKRHSDFVSHPIIFEDEREEIEKDAEGKPAKDGRASVIVEDKILNSMKPIWTRPQCGVSEGEYSEFYKHISHDLEEPLETISVKAEGILECLALMFIPTRAPYDLYYHAAEVGLRLYARGVLVMEQCEALLPRYLRFVKGVVDSADLPLNISRQTLQQDRHLRQICKWLTKKILDVLQNMQDGEPDKYLRFWEQFGRALKEGTGSDYDHKDRIVSLLLFASSHDPKKLTTLKDYVARMREGQQEIFYLTGETRSVVENSPQLEAFIAKGYEVLYLVDSVDELLVQSVTEYDGHKLKSVGKGAVKLGDKEESEQIEQELKRKTEAAADLLQFLQTRLDKYIKDVRLTNRLTTSPVCLVGAELDYSPHLERLLQMGKGTRPKQRRIMELNPQHEIFTKMQARFQSNTDDYALGDYADLLFGHALLAEGSELPDPVRFNSLVGELIARNL